MSRMALFLGRPTFRGLLIAGMVLLGLSGGWFMAVHVAGFDGLGMLACL